MAHRASDSRALISPAGSIRYGRAAARLPLGSQHERPPWNAVQERGGAVGAVELAAGSACVGSDSIDSTDRQTHQPSVPIIPIGNRERSTVVNRNALRLSSSPPLQTEHAEAISGRTTAHSK